MALIHMSISMYPGGVWWTFQSNGILWWQSWYTPWLGEQLWEAWSIDHQLLWIQVRCTRMVRALQFAPSTLFPLERTFKYTKPCAIYLRGQTQFHHRSSLEWLLVGSDGGRVGRSFLLGNRISYDYFHMSLIFFANPVHDFVIWHTG